MKILIALTSIFLAQVSAQALAATSSASLSTFTVTLNDLDLNDGIAPSITWGFAGDLTQGFALNSDLNTPSAYEYIKSFDFTLSPNTQASLSVSASVAVTGGYASSYGGIFTYAGARISNLQSSTTGSTDGLGAMWNESNNRILNITYNNPTNLFEQESLNLLVQTVITEQASTVPEPNTYAMILGGLGLVGFTTRRRKSC